VRKEHGKIGNNDAYDVDTRSADYFDISLDDIVKCPDEIVTLDVGERCGATYTWSDGSSGHTMTTSQPGKYTVSVTWHGFTSTDEIQVSLKNAVSADLGSDRAICNGEQIKWDLSNLSDVDFLWDDGSTSPVRTVSRGGNYWVKITGECTTTTAVQISEVERLSLDLGDDVVLCGNAVMIGKEVDNADYYRWTDNSTKPMMIVNQPGNYTLTVGNECEEISDSINVKEAPFDMENVPNIVTEDGNEINDHFIVPGKDESKIDLIISNRWGRTVFQTDDYQNDWPAESLTPGMYFYTLKGSCLIKGIIHVVGN
jgi:large repetitive protein